MQHDFILMDRSGSMGLIWSEAVGSVNGYVKKLAEDNVDTGVTIAVFDSVSFDTIRDRIIPRTMKPIDLSEAQPRGGTPLNDSIVKLVTMAEKGNYDRVAIVIMTDGQENASQEDRTGIVAKAALDRCRARGWQVIMLGANFDNTQQATTLGNHAAQTMSVNSANLSGVLRQTASKRAVYGATGQSIGYSEEDRKEAVK
jgi:Mg-chelatase subunit ChlD